MPNEYVNHEHFINSHVEIIKIIDDFTNHLSSNAKNFKIEFDLGQDETTFVLLKQKFLLLKEFKVKNDSKIKAKLKVFKWNTLDCKYEEIENFFVEFSKDYIGITRFKIKSRIMADERKDLDYEIKNNPNLFYEHLIEKLVQDESNFLIN